MGWDLKGRHVVGRYIGQFPVTGTVESSRVKYGGSVSHTVLLDDIIEVYGDIRERVLLDQKDIDQVSPNT